MTAVAITHRDHILAQITAGKRLSDIAPDLGVSPQALSKALKNDKDYSEAMYAGFGKRIDMAEDAIQDAAEQVDVSRARAYWSAISWRAEREFPDRWGTKPIQVNIGAAVLLDQSAVGAISDLLERVAQTKTVDISPDAAQQSTDSEKVIVPELPQAIDGQG